MDRDKDNVLDEERYWHSLWKFVAIVTIWVTCGVLCYTAGRWQERNQLQILVNQAVAESERGTIEWRQQHDARMTRLEGTLNSLLLAQIGQKIANGTSH